MENVGSDYGPILMNELQNRLEQVVKNFNNEVQNFIQVCPKEMLDKLTNPLLLKTKISKAV